MYQRKLIDPISKWIDKKEVIILYGARQVGKTTLLHQLIETRDDSLILNCEIPEINDVLGSKNLSRIKALFGNHRLLALDEAQKVPDIGSVLKLIYDELPGYKIIATGSSSFDLASNIVEPLTGRNVKFRLYPLSLSEIRDQHNWLRVMENLNDLLVYGSYPGMIDQDADSKKILLQELSSDYLYKDILIFESVKNPSLIRKLLKALALQIGSQVSANELSKLLGVSRPTVEKYLDLLEKSFVIFQISSYSSNLRNEIRKSRKYYFHDPGIRNAIIGDFSAIENRTDFGVLWENFCISERLKVLNIMQPNTNIYFWRTYDGAEIDLVEEHNRELRAFEFKWKEKRKISIPGSFAEKYNVPEWKVITPTDLHELIEVD